MEAVEGHIEEYFGEFENVFHEIVSPDIHVDICVVPPSEERDYYTLVTICLLYTSCTMTSSAVVTEMSGRNKRRRDACISKNTGATLSRFR